MKKSENILLLGLGGLGFYLTKRLSQEGHQVTVIERDPILIEKGQRELDARLVQGDATDFRTWQKASASHNDYVVCVTNDDAVNLVAAMLAKQFGIEYKVVRNSTIDLWSGGAVLQQEHLGIDQLIRPEELAAQEVVRLCKMRAGNAFVNVGDGQLQVVAINVERQSIFAHMLVADLAKKYDRFPFQIVCVTRDIQTIVPYGNFKLEPGDHLFVLLNKEDVKYLLEYIDSGDRLKKRNVLIVGGGLVGSRVAELLQDDYNVRLIENHEDKAENLTFKLRNTTVLLGDGADKETLMTAGLLKMDTIVASTTDNDTNILVTVLAKHLIHTHRPDFADQERTIALIKREEYAMLAAALGTDFAVNDKILAANEFMRYLRRGHVLSVQHLHGCDAEIVELLADEGSQITKQRLSEFRGFSGDFIIGAIRRGEQWIIASGQMQIKPGERVISVCADNSLGDLQRLFLK
jgi:trk system potassium uptake protein TrkA